MAEQRRASTHRALADPRRARIVDELEGHPAGLDARELARVLGVHPNTVRWHLEVLADAGLIASHPDRRTARGRPRIIFTLTDRGEPDNYRLLATMLMSTLSALPDAADRIYNAGRAWGRYLLPRLQPGPPPSRRQTTQLVANLLSREGFRPEVTQDEIRMHGCPFRELAQHGDALVCTFHRGLIAGALAELGDDVRLRRLDAFVAPQLCIARLTRGGESSDADNRTLLDDRMEIT
jgi:predicted ArsR family transcriptional regulator